MSRRDPIHSRSRTPRQQENDYEPESASDNEKSTQNEEKTASDMDEQSDTNEEICNRLVPPSPKVQTPNKPRQQIKQSFPVQQEENNFRYLLLAAIAIIIIAIFFAAPWKKSDFKFCRFDKLRKQSPQQTDLVWDTLSAGLELQLNKLRKTPSVYLLMYQSNNSNRNKKLQELINDIASEASICFDNTRKPVKMTHDDFAAPNGDYGYAIERYKEKIQQGKVLLIVNLNQIPAHAALALHTICDTVSPIADDVVIFLTLHVPNATFVGSSVQLATDALNELWGQQLKYNELDPLITRVIDQVLLLQT